MSVENELIIRAKDSILNYDKEEAIKVAEEALKNKIEPSIVIEKGFSEAMTEIGNLFELGQIFLPHVIAASETMSAGVEAFGNELEKKAAQTSSLGTVVIGTIEGDIHSIGKDIVATMLEISGFCVIDLGRDVPVKKYIEEAKANNANVVASSALMTTTMVNQITLEEGLKEAGLRDKIKTMVGGAPVTQTWADQIGADVYGENATDAVSKLTNLFTV